MFHVNGSRLETAITRYGECSRSARVVRLIMDVPVAYIYLIYQKMQR